MHSALAARDATLRHDPAVIVCMTRSAGPTAFFRQRLAHGREFGRSRGSGSSWAANAGRALLAAVVPIVLLARTTREVAGRKRLRAQRLASLPALFAFDVAWVVGEARGHLDVLRDR